MPWRTKWQLIPEIPWTEELGGLQSKGPQRVRHDRATEHTHTHTQGDGGDRDTDAETDKQALASQRDVVGM